MLKRTLLLISVIFAGSLLVAITAKTDNQMIPSGEVQKMNELRNKMIQSKAIEGQSALNKVEKNLVKKYKKSLSQKNKLMGKLKVEQAGKQVIDLHTIGTPERACTDCEFDFTP